MDFSIACTDTVAWSGELGFGVRAAEKGQTAESDKFSPPAPKSGKKR